MNYSKLPFRKVPFVDLKVQNDKIRNEIDSAIDRVISSSRFIGGPEIENFENRFSSYQKTKYAVGVASGTSAILLTLLALGVGEGDEVITTPHTFMATVEPIEILGAKSVLVDIDPITYNIDPSRIEGAITPSTKVILPVHLYGQMAPMDVIMDIANRRGIWVIEDAAQAHGAKYLSKRAGEWGHAACFSFFPSKNLGAFGDSGAICTNDSQLANKLEKLRNHGRQLKYRHEIIGLGERMDELQAAILAVKLQYLDIWNQARRQHADHYNKILNDSEDIIIPIEFPDAYHVYHIYSIRVKKERKKILQKLTQMGIEVGVHYPIPIHLQSSMTHYNWNLGDFPIAEDVAGSIISLPMFPEITRDQLDYVINELMDIVKCA